MQLIDESGQAMLFAKLTNQLIAFVKRILVRLCCARNKQIILSRSSDELRQDSSGGHRMTGQENGITDKLKND